MPPYLKGDHMILRFYSDPGHGWLAAPKTLIARLGIDALVSSYSYQSASTVYLEEDSDAGLLIDAMREAGIPVDIRARHTSRRSRIRNLPSYR